MAPQENGQPSAMCSCGRPRDDAERFMHHATSGRYVYRRCACGIEWTERSLVDVTAPIETDELIEVHVRLKALKGSFDQLLGLGPAA